MLSVPGQMRIYLCRDFVDMRKSFDGLSGIVEAVFQRNVVDGDLFLFVNRRRDRVKALWFDRDGLVLWCKRLERGTFEVPSSTTAQSHVELDATDLAMMLNGVTLATAKRRLRYSAVS